MAVVARVILAIQSINNIHRELPLWRIVLNWKLVLSGVVVLAAGSYGGMRFYKRVTHDHLLKHAEVALADNNPQGAAMFALRLLRDDPKDVAAARLMVKITEPWPSESLVWHAKLHEVRPEDADNCLAWAKAGLEAGRLDVAAEALRDVPSSSRASGEFEFESSQLDLAKGDFQAAESHLSAAAKASPTDEHIALALAKARLRIPGEKRAEGREALDQLSHKSSTSVEALRSLANDAERHQQESQTVAYLLKLAQQPGATHEDQMRLLDLLVRMGDPSALERVKAYQSQIQDNPSRVSSMAFWMNANGMAAETVRWVQSLPAESQRQPSVQAALTQSYAQTGDWVRLKALVDKEDWGNMDYLRIAFRARSIREQGDAQQSKDQWNLSVLKASDHPEALALLCQTALNWGSAWAAEAEELGWRVAADPHASKAVLNAMQSRFVEAGDTRKFYRLLLLRRKLEPDDAGVQNNFALLSMLLKQNEPAAFQAAESLAKENPTDANLVSTYAYALLLQGRKEEALTMMNRFSQVELRLPAVAPYYGILLASANDPRATTYLERAKRSPLLLPEERELVNEAEKRASKGER